MMMSKFLLLVVLIVYLVSQRFVWRCAYTKITCFSCTACTRLFRLPASPNAAAQCGHAKSRRFSCTVCTCLFRLFACRSSVLESLPTFCGIGNGSRLYGSSDAGAARMRAVLGMSGALERLLHLPMYQPKQASCGLWREADRELVRSGRPYVA